MVFRWISIFKFWVTQEIREIQENKNAKINNDFTEYDNLYVIIMHTLVLI
jgi:hypothetical protein